MSHVRCPMCGLDKAIDYFDPETLESDINVRKAIGKGYGQGFGFGPDISILGDEEITPKVKNRCLELLRLLLDVGVISQHEVMDALNFGIRIYDSDKFYDWKELFENTNRKLNNQTSSYKRLESENRSSSMRTAELSIKNEELEKKLKEQNTIDGILKGLQKVSESQVDIFDDEWVIIINEINIETFNYLCKSLYPLDHRMRGMVEKRILTDCSVIINIFNFFRFEPKIADVFDLLIEKPNSIYYSPEIYSFPLKESGKDNLYTGFPSN